VSIGVAIGLGVAFPVVFFVGLYMGNKSALWANRRQLQAGAEYLAALEQAMRECSPGTTLQVSLAVEREAQPSRSAQVPLRLLEKP
jgi:hypothetical protein